MARTSGKGKVEDKVTATGTAKTGPAKAAKKTAANAIAATAKSASVSAKASSRRPAAKASAAAPRGNAAKASTTAAPKDAGSKAAKATAKKASSRKTASSRAAAAAKSTAAARPSKPAAGSRAKASAGTGAGRAKRRAGNSERPWLKSYPEGIAAEIGSFRHASLVDMMLESCREYGDRPVFTSMGTTITFAELEKASRDFAAYLQSTGLRKGARVALMMPNVLQYPVAMMAALRAGYVVVNVNPLYTPRELEYQLKDAGAEAIVVLENFAKTLEAVIADTPVRHVVVTAMGDMMGLRGHLTNFVVRRLKKMVPAWNIPGHVPFRQAVRQGAAARFAPPEVTLDDPAFLQYTGGTTGVAKGAMLLHRNVLANVMQCDLWFSGAWLTAPRPEREVHLCALPLYHIYALTVNGLMGIKVGAHNILIANPRDIPALVKEFGKYRINAFPGLNTLFNALLTNPDFQRLDFSDLKLTFGGGMAVQRSVAERWKALTGCKITEGYGLSETSPVATANRFDVEEFTGSIGVPIPSTDVAIRDEAGRDVKTGEVGEICIRGPQVMAGYWNRPDETAKVMTADSFFRTGDMGVMDENGYVRLVDRKKDMIVVSGFKVFPNELEDVVAHHPGVLEVAAIGVPDEHSGEVPKLFVVKKDPALTEKDVLVYCRDRLTGYKRPKHVEFRDELPKSNVGKIMRRALR